MRYYGRGPTAETNIISESSVCQHRNPLRLNLLKNFAASTLEIFQSEYTFEKRARRMGDHEGGEGACAGPVFGSLRLLFPFFC